jgi:hypothetical protein
MFITELIIQVCTYAMRTSVFGAQLFAQLCDSFSLVATQVCPFRAYLK